MPSSRVATSGYRALELTAKLKKKRPPDSGGFFCLGKKKGTPFGVPFLLFDSEDDQVSGKTGFGASPPYV